MKSLKLSILLTGIVALGGCQSDAVKYEDKPPMTREEERRAELGKLFGEDLTLMGGTEKRSDSNNKISVNSFLWRAALDTVKFMPLRSADPFGGVIMTEWYTDRQTPNERFKVDILITSRHLRSDGVRVAIHQQIRTEKGWVDRAVEPATMEEFENAILQRARELKING